MDTERDRIDRLLAGDERAAEELLGKYQKLLRFVLGKMDVPESVREDVAQNVWMDVWRQLRNGQFRGDCAFSTWLGLIAKGKVLDYRRHRDTSGASALVAIDQATSAIEARSAVAADQEALAAAEQALDSLDDRLQLAFRLRYRQNHEVADIARALGLSRPRTYALLDEARTKFCAAVLGAENPGRSRRLRE